MKAFNTRMRVPRLFGVPLNSMVALMVALLSLSFSLFLPVVWLRLICGLMCVTAIVAALYYYRAGDELPFVRLRRQERHRSGLHMPGGSGD